MLEMWKIIHPGPCDQNMVRLPATMIACWPPIDGWIYTPTLLDR